MKDILIAGIAGAGKGTQARELQKHLGTNIQYFEPGSVFRAFGSNDNIIGNYAETFTKAGKLLPDAFIKNVLGLVFASLHEGNRLLIDGFPRMYSQKAMFTEVMQEKGRDFVLFHLTVSNEIAQERLLHRLICPECGSTYSTLLNPTVTHCVYDNIALIQREDDKSHEAIKHRFEAYYSDIKRVVDEYREEGKVIDIDGTLSISDVTQKILEHIE